MAQTLRIQGEVFHIPSVARARLFSSIILGRPIMKVVNHDGHEWLLKYKVNDWDTAIRDFKKLDLSRTACFEALKQIPVWEDSEKVSIPLTSEMK